MSTYNKKSYFSEKVNIKRLVLYYILLVFILFLAAAVQSSGLKIFGAAPAITFVSVCAAGFVFGERSGAIFGLIGGIFCDTLGFSGIMISPILFTVIGYLCGRFVGWFLSKNLPSFIVYGLISGLIKEIFTLLVIGVASTDFKLWYALGQIIIPEYFSTAIFICPIYLVMAGIYRLFSLKDKKEFRF